MYTYTCAVSCFMRSQSMVRKETLPLVFKRELGSRVGLLRRDAPCFTGKPEEGNLTPVQWFDLPTGFVFHGEA